MSIDLFCFVDCVDGYYGASCDQCGHCANNTVCDKTSGHCPASCEVAFQPPLCKSRKNKIRKLLIYTFYCVFFAASFDRSFCCCCCCWYCFVVVVVAVNGFFFFVAFFFWGGGGGGGGAG